MLNTILRKEFKMVSEFFFDDKFGFELDEHAEHALKVVKGVHSWVGASLEERHHMVSN